MRRLDHPLSWAQYIDSAGRERARTYTLDLSGLQRATRTIKHPFFGAGFGTVPDQ